MVISQGKSFFWTLYALFFAVPFPAFLYYMITYAGGGSRSISMLSNPYLALVFLAVSVVLWFFLLERLFRKWFFLPLAERRRANELLRSGTARDAEVVARHTVGRETGETTQLDVTFRFNNLSGVPIRETLRVVDSRPLANRFTVGRHVRLRIDNTLTESPATVIEGLEFHLNRTRWFLTMLSWLLLVAAVAACYVIIYRYEHQGTGWRFLTFYHPLLVCPVALLFTQRLFGGGLTRLFDGGKNMLPLKYRGYRADARLLDAKQTGTYINEQPEVRFNLEYEDRKGTTHLVSLRKIVDLLEMDVTRASTIPIFYLADQPQTVAFAADLGGDDEQQR